MCGLVLRFFVHGGILIGVIQAVVEEEISMLLAGVLAIGASVLFTVSTVIFAIPGTLVGGTVAGLISGAAGGATLTGVLLGVVISALFGTEIKRSMWAGGLYVILAIAFEVVLILAIYAMTSTASAAF